MLIENSKTYKGQEIESIFFRPIFTGKAADEFGVRVLYNMPVPTTVQMWSNRKNILQDFTSGWNGGSTAIKHQQTIDMKKVKAENCFSSEDYSSLIYEKILASADVNFGDLTGTDLEKAETEVFRYAIAESVRATMWIGDTTGNNSYHKTFDGFISHLYAHTDSGLSDIGSHIIDSIDDVETGKDIFDICWSNALEQLKALRSEGHLAFYVSSDIYNKYLQWLDDKIGDAAYAGTIDGHTTLLYHGIPVIEVPLMQYDQFFARSFCVLTDRRNLVLALNTADSPENEVRMWYNPDEMENRQRAVFLAGTAVVNPDLVSWAYTE